VEGDISVDHGWFWHSKSPWSSDGLRPQLRILEKSALVSKSLDYGLSDNGFHYPKNGNG
jgi:hypothetical protein